MLHTSQPLSSSHLRRTGHSSILPLHRSQLIAGSPSPWHTQSPARRLSRSFGTHRLCRCQAGDKGRTPFLQQLGEWGAKLLGIKQRPRKSSRTQQQSPAPPPELSPPTPSPSSAASTSQSPPSPSPASASASTSSPPPPTPSTSGSDAAQQQRQSFGEIFNGAAVKSTDMQSIIRRQLQDKQVRMQPEKVREAVHRQMREAVHQLDPNDEASASELWSLEQPEWPEAPDADADWEDWEQYFYALDKNANWSRRLSEEVEQYLSWGQFDMAAPAQAKLDKALHQDVVHQIMKEFRKAVEDQDYAKAAHLRDAGGAGLPGWWYANGQDNSVGGYLLQIVPEPHHSCYAGYMVTASDLCTVEAQQPRSMISGELGSWHAQSAAAQNGGSIIIQGQEVKGEGEEPQPSTTVDDIGHAIMELYVNREPDGTLSQHATVLRQMPEEPDSDDEGIPEVSAAQIQGIESLGGFGAITGEVVSDDDANRGPVHMDVHQTNDGTVLSVSVDFTKASSSNDSSRGQDDSAATPSTSSSQDTPSDMNSEWSTHKEQLEQFLSRLQQALPDVSPSSSSSSSDGETETHEIVFDMGAGEIGGVEIEGNTWVDAPMVIEEELEELEKVERIKAHLVQIDRNRIALNVERDPEREAAVASPVSQPSTSSSTSMQVFSGSRSSSSSSSSSSKDSDPDSQRRQVIEQLEQLAKRTDGPIFSNMAKQLGDAMRSQNKSLDSGQLSGIVHHILMHVLQQAIGALQGGGHDPHQHIAMHGLTGTTHFTRVPMYEASTDPFSGVFLDPFNQSGAELYLLERAKGEDGQDSVTAVKISSTENVSAGNVAFKASLAPRKRLAVSGVYNDDLHITGRYSAQCRLASVNSLNARWNDAELLQFSSRAPHGADLGLLTGGRGSGHHINWLKRMHLPTAASSSPSCS